VYSNTSILTSDCIQNARRQPALPSEEIDTHSDSRAIHTADTCRHVSLKRPNVRALTVAMTMAVARDDTEVTVCGQQQFELGVIDGSNVSVQPSAECSDGSR